MDSHELDILTRLDTELPVVDGKVIRLTELVKLLVDAPTLAALEQSYRDGLVAFGARCTATDHGPVTEADVAFLFDAVHASIPAGTDPVAIIAMDDRLARLIEVGASIAGGRGPLPPARD